jgi:hypothetical protein
MVKGTNSMRLVFTLGRMTVFDFTLFDINDGVTNDPDVVVVHHYNDDEDEDHTNDGPDDLFGGKG